MKCPAFWMGLGLCLGIIAEHLKLIPAEAAFAGFLFVLPLLWFSRGRRTFLFCLVLSLSFLGFLSAGFDGKRPPNAVEQWTGRKVNLEGIVQTEPEIKTHGKKRTLSFVLSSRNLMMKGGGEFFETQGNVQVFLFQPENIPKAGDRVRLWGSLEKARPVLNPGGFDYGKYLAQHKNFAIFNGFGRYSIRILGNEASPVQRYLYKFRRKIIQKIDALYPENSAVLFRALILGLRKNVPGSLRDDLLKTGTAHLLAISGLHIALVAGNVYFLLILLRASQKLAAAAGLVTAIGYVFLASSGIPVLRAGLMASAVFIGLLIERENHFLNSFFMAFFILLCLEPASLFQISFQLSFLSVFSLVYLLPSFFKSGQFKETSGHSAGVMLGTFPVVIYYFYVFSPISLLANLIAVPMFSLALCSAFVSLVLSEVPLLGGLMAKCAAGLIQWGLAWIHGLAALKQGFIYLQPPSVGHLLIYYLFLSLSWAIQFSKKTFPYGLRALAASCWLVSLGSFFLPAAGVDFSLTLFAAGRNDIAHLRWGRDIHWLINTGRGKPSDQGRWIVTPYLRHQGVNHLTGIFVTDCYARHSGGLSNILNNFSLDYLVHPAIMPPHCQNNFPKFPRSVNQRPLHAGAKIRVLKKGKIEILGMVKNQTVFKVQQGAWSFLFLPSMDEKLLEILEARRHSLQKIDIVIFPPIQKTGSAPDFGFYDKLLDRIDPQYVVSPLPQKGLEDVLTVRGIRFLSLPELGAIQFQVGANSGGWPIGAEPSDERLFIHSYLKGEIATISSVQKSSFAPLTI
ncbi:MAG TPA: ComEC/Rec2 family competence protein [bacterium]|nr:ComEC/Rec2 family competence protein [bacterium]